MEELIDNYIAEIITCVLVNNPDPKAQQKDWERQLERRDYLVRLIKNRMLEDIASQKR